MAVKRTAKAKEEKVEVAVEAVETATNETTDSPVEVVTEAVANVDTANIPEEKNAKVRIKEDCHFYFGGEMYSFKKGQLTTVPKDVKLHLAGQDLLSAL